MPLAPHPVPPQLGQPKMSPVITKCPLGRNPPIPLPCALRAINWLHSIPHPDPPRSDSDELLGTLINIQDLQCGWEKNSDEGPPHSQNLGRLWDRITYIKDPILWPDQVTRWPEWLKLLPPPYSFSLSILIPGNQQCQTKAHSKHDHSLSCQCPWKSPTSLIWFLEVVSHLGTLPPFFSLFHPLRPGNMI